MRCGGVVVVATKAHLAASGAVAPGSVHCGNMGGFVLDVWLEERRGLGDKDRGHRWCGVGGLRGASHVSSAHMQLSRILV
mmetsp:Transcript_21728/g.31858  ORF Transcript_21728/g.31858 Transcript_21728/m.31858 type:complete len:80 (-) Transcript_21728:85-324(-)